MPAGAGMLIAIDAGNFINLKDINDMSNYSAGAAFRKAMQEESPLQVVGAINANHALLAKRAGFKAIYLSGGGVAAGSLGLPDLGISNLDDVLTDVRRITDVCDLPLLVDVDTGFGSSAFNVARTVKSMIKFGAAAMHIEDQVGAKRCGHRPNKEIVTKQEMVDRIKAAVDARTDENFVIMARTDALAVEGLEAAIDRAQACVEAGADMIFPEAITELAMYKQFADAVKVPILANITEFGSTPLLPSKNWPLWMWSCVVSIVSIPRDEQSGGKCVHRDSPRRHAKERGRYHANPSWNCMNASTITISSKMDALFAQQKNK
jgi:methylisocitrate lyase